MSDPTRPVSYTFEVSSYPQAFVAEPGRRRPYWLNVLLLLSTLFTTLVIGARLQYNFVHDLPAYDADTYAFTFLHLGWIIHQPRLILMGIPFSFTLMGILLAHELGHFLFCEWNRVYATWPYFIPAPILSPIGTFGAVIRIKSPIRSRKALFDIGIAGPIAGFLVALPVLLWGLALSKPLSAKAATSVMDFGYPLIFHIFHRLLIPFTHNTAPMSELYLHPVGVAAWVGMLATALNLLPGGQFDGGHIIYAIAPRAHKWVTRGTVGALIPLGLFFWSGWLVWAIILAFAAARHPNVPQWPEIGVARRWMSALAILMLVLTLVPAPVHGYAIIRW
jgi:membrane-associated protease RseP (regulator of RpoE activity)